MKKQRSLAARNSKQNDKLIAINYDMKKKAFERDRKYIYLQFHAYSCL